MADENPNLLLVEGKDEKYTLPELLEAAGIRWDKTAMPAFIKACDGLENLLQKATISAELKASGRRALGIVIDANGDPQGNWARLKDAAERAASEFNDDTFVDSLPDALPETGFITTLRKNGIRVGFWVMPNNRDTGMFETALLRLRAGDKTSDLARLDEIIETALTSAWDCGAPFKDVHRDKARLYTWLAWQDPPGQHITVAVKQKLLQPSDTFTGFVSWFHGLFG